MISKINKEGKNKVNEIYDLSLIILPKRSNEIKEAIERFFVNEKLTINVIEEVDLAYKINGHVKADRINSIIFFKDDSNLKDASNKIKKFIDDNSRLIMRSLLLSSKKEKPSLNSKQRSVKRRLVERKRHQEERRSQEEKKDSN